MAAVTRCTAVLAPLPGRSRRRQPASGNRRVEQAKHAAFGVVLVNEPGEHRLRQRRQVHDEVPVAAVAVQPFRCLFGPRDGALGARGNAHAARGAASGLMAIESRRPLPAPAPCGVAKNRSVTATGSRPTAPRNVELLFQRIQFLAGEPGFFHHARKRVVENGGQGP